MEASSSPPRRTPPPLPKKLRAPRPDSGRARGAARRRRAGSSRGARSSGGDDSSTPTAAERLMMALLGDGDDGDGRGAGSPGAAGGAGGKTARGSVSQQALLGADTRFADADADTSVRITENRGLDGGDMSRVLEEASRPHLPRRGAPPRVVVRDRRREATVPTDAATGVVDLETATRIVGGADATPSLVSKLLREHGDPEKSGGRCLPTVERLVGGDPDPDDDPDRRLIYLVTYTPLNVYDRAYEHSTELARGEHPVELWDIETGFEDPMEAGAYRDARNVELYADTFWETKLSGAEKADVRRAMESASSEEEARVKAAKRTLQDLRRAVDRGEAEGEPEELAARLEAAEMRTVFNPQPRRAAFLARATALLQAKLDETIPKVVQRMDGGMCVVSTYLRRRTRR